MFLKILKNLEAKSMLLQSLRLYKLLKKFLTFIFQKFLKNSYYLIQSIKI